MRWKVRVGVLGEDPTSKELRLLQEEIRSSARVKKLLERRDKAGRLVSGRGVYDNMSNVDWDTRHLQNAVVDNKGLQLEAATEQAKAERAAAKDAAKPAVKTEAELKAARDARYAARKARK